MSDVKWLLNNRLGVIDYYNNHKGLCDHELVTINVSIVLINREKNNKNINNVTNNIVVTVYDNYNNLLCYRCNNNYVSIIPDEDAECICNLFNVIITRDCKLDIGVNLDDSYYKCCNKIRNRTHEVLRVESDYYMKLRVTYD